MMKRYALILLAACGGHETSAPVAQGSAAPFVYTAPKDPLIGLDLRLSNGKQGAPGFDHAKLAPATKLSDAEVTQLLARATPLEAQAGDTAAFALRPSSTPPPRTGDTVKTTFPPPPSDLMPPAASDAGKDLRVLRYMPQGEVPYAPELSITFSQPMVAVTSQSDAAATVPVTLTPTPKGRWRWVGTRTVLFDPDPRFPQATTYQVEVPGGTKSANGGVLKDGVTFSFETPAPKLVASYPGSYTPQKLDVPMWIEFDQKIDPQAMLAAIKVTGAKGWDDKPLAIRLLDAKEVAADKQLATLVDQANKDDHEGKWLAFKTVAPLPIDTQITVTVPPGAPSAEGPNKTKAAQSFGFHTYPPLEVDHYACDPTCPPSSPLWVRFNNPLDEDAFDDAIVTVKPDIPGLRVIAQGEMIEVMGATKARTSYTITIGKALKDDFGQVLGRAQSHTFKVGDAYPTFYGPSGLVVLDPSATKPTLDFFSTNYDALKVKLYAVEPSDLPAFGNYIDNQWNHDHPPRIPGRKVMDALVKVPGGKNELVETHVDLSSALHDGRGHVLAIVEPSPWKELYEPPRMVAWVQATKLAVDAHVDNDSLVAFATELGSGKPAAGVNLEIRPYGIKAVTDDKGMATLPLADVQQTSAHYLLASKDKDSAFVAESWSDYGDWVKHARTPQLAWYVVDDRKLYKPGEEVSLKGWLRTIDYGKNGDVGPSSVKSVSYKVMDSVGNQIAQGTANVDAIGGFDTKFTLPKTPNLGYAQIYFDAGVGAYQHPIQIEEFRRPEFEVSAHASDGPFVVGGGGDVVVSAKYFSGGPLPGAQVSWFVTASQTTFTPPNRDDYVFGQWRPWWGYRGWYEDEADDEPKGERSPMSWSFDGKTDGAGDHDLRMDFVSVKPAMPMSVTANATVYDVNRQAWTASQAMIVHPSLYYVGLKAKKPFVEKGSPFDLDVIGVDLDGKAVKGAKMDLRAVRLDWEYKKGRYHKKEVDPQTCAVVAAVDPKHCQFETKKGGTYEVTATIVDPNGRPNETKMTFWVSGGEEPPMRDVAQEKVNLIPDKKEYTAGNTAEIMVQAPWYPAEGVVTWRRSGIVHVERLTMTGPSASLAVPITDAMVPNLDVQVDLVGMAVRTNDAGDPDPKLPKRPAFATGSLSLAVPPKQRALAVSVTPTATKLSPGQSTKLTVEVKDAAGKPVPNAQTAVIVVDEAVLSLTGYQFPDPIGSFYPLRTSDTTDFYERSYVKLSKPQLATFTGTTRGRGISFARGEGGGGLDVNGELAGGAMPVAAAAPMEKELRKADEPPPPPAKAKAKTEQKPMAITADKSSQADYYVDGINSTTTTPKPPPPIAIRSNFNPLAAFAPAVTTGPDGRAVVDVKVPDNLTRYRVVAIAVAGAKQYGKGESAVTARLPLMVRPSPPRFLNFGDVFELPVVVQNQTDAPMTVKLAARTANARLTDGAGRQVTVPANDRVEVQFPASAELAGTARFQVVGAAGDATDAATFELPVWTPATTEAFATYGVIDSGATKQPVALPGKVVEQFGGLEVTTASTNLQALTDAMLYLVHYPFECAEQRSSRILAIAGLRDVLSVFKTKDMPTAAQMEHSVDVDIEHLSQMQNYDGGFAFWDRGYPSEPYLTVFVTNALQHAKAKGFTVPQNILDRAHVYLRDIESHYPPFYPTDVRRAISAYALYTRKQMGDLDIAKGKKLLADAGGPDKLSMEADGWLLGLFAGNPSVAAERKQLVTYALNHVSETAGAANFVTGYGDGKYLLLASDRRVDGVMLEALIQEQKDLDLIPKLVTGLLAHRTRGRWDNTQENAFVLLALDLYFQTYEKVTPDFVARVWLGNDYAGDHTFKGRSTEYAQIDIAMKDVATHDKQDLTIQKDGAGRLYYRIGMKYAPADLKIEPADYGFVVERRYEGADDPKDVTRAADGTWHIRAGSRVRVKLTMVNENRRYHVALVDPLPAGLEPMNPALATTGPIPQDPGEQKARGAYWWWYGPWYEHQNLRDERVEAFASLLWEGVHEYTYVARATTPGSFVVPPPKAEEMYMPETFGRGGSDRVIVE
jgi:uncharacterized protein YfaS (alpha-2-macroglobulin family)